MRIAVIAPGAMGAGVARRLQARGAAVAVTLQNRGVASAARRVAIAATNCFSFAIAPNSRTTGASSSARVRPDSAAGGDISRANFTRPR